MSFGDYTYNQLIGSSGYTTLAGASSPDLAGYSPYTTTTDAPPNGSIGGTGGWSGTSIYGDPIHTYDSNSGTYTTPYFGDPILKSAYPWDQPIYPWDHPVTPWLPTAPLVDTALLELLRTEEAKRIAREAREMEHAVEVANVQVELQQLLTKLKIAEDKILAHEAERAAERVHANDSKPKERRIDLDL